MRRRTITPVALLVAVCLNLTHTALWAYSGGTGEPNDPYQIATTADLIELGNDPCNYDKHFILTADIDLSGYSFDRAVIAPDQTANEYYSGTEFSGVFDGHGYVIHHLQIEGRNFLGLFGSCRSTAMIVNLGLEDVDIIGEPSRYYYYIAGLVGVNSGKVTSCYSTGTVSGDGYSGGLVGVNFGTVNSCYSSGTTHSGSDSGGLVGYNQGIIVSCYSSGTHHSTFGLDVGGLVGVNIGTVTSCYSTKTVNGSGSVGGLVGDNGGLVWDSNKGVITASYSTGAVTGGGDVGGLVGHNHKGTISLSFWDTETSGLSDSAGGLGLSTVEMQTFQTYDDAGWDLVNESAHGTCNYWLMEDQEYPKLAVFSGWVPPEPYGHGTVEDPYIITDVNELGAVWYRSFASYRLEADLDLAGMTWNSAVIPAFSGTFDGQGHVISHLQIQGGNHLGLFGVCFSAVTITNLGLEAVDIIGDPNSNYIGGLVGQNYGAVTSCYSSGTVSGGGSVGGLLGVNDKGAILLSHSSGTVSGISSIGGLVGENHGPITSSYSSEDVSGNDSVGGLAGINDSPITAGYSTGDIGGNNSVGGLVGENHGVITLSYSAGAVSGNDSVGGLAGGNNSSITSSYNSGEVCGKDSIGGLVGYNDRDGTIMSSYSTGAVSGDNSVGGLVGANNSPITLSHSSGNVTGKDSVGGFVGYNDRDGTIMSSYSTGAVSGGNSVGEFNSIGGFVGYNDGSIKSSYSTGTVSGDAGSVGGLVGYNDGSIASSYSTGPSSSSEGFVGGLVGYNDGTIESSYSIGEVDGDLVAGGLVGWNWDGTTTSSFWDTETSGQSESLGGMGRTTTEMQNINTFLDAGWDFVDETGNGTEDLWWMPEGDYPRLWWEEVN